MSFLGNLLGGVANAVGSLPFIGESAKGIVSPIIGALGGATQESEQRQYQNDYAWTQMHNQFMLNSELMDKSNAFASLEAQKTRDWNTLQAQMARAREAGVNPVSLLGSTGVGGSSAQASPVSASVGLPSMSHMPNGILDLAALSQVLMNTSQGIKINKETSRYDEQIDALLSNYAADVSLKKVQKDAQDLANDITRMFGKSRAAYECTKLFEEALMAAANGRKSDAEARLADATAALKHSEKKSLDLQIPFIEKRMQAEVDLLLEQQETEKSKQEENRASAQEHRAGAAYKSALATTENKFRDVNYELKNLEVDLATLAKYSAGNDLEVSDATVEARKVGIVNALAREGIITESARQELIKKSKEAEWADKMLYQQYWTGFFNAASGAIGAASSASGTYLNRLSQKERNSIQRDFNERWERISTRSKTGYNYEDGSWKPSWRTD